MSFASSIGTVVQRHSATSLFAVVMLLAVAMGLFGWLYRPNRAAAETTGLEMGTCLVMHSPLEAGKAVTVTYKGVPYRLCCNGCISLFQKAPERYIEAYAQGGLHPQSAPASTPASPQQ